jgi:[acyl-carrier-protein] S-malonyltransferase
MTAWVFLFPGQGSQKVGMGSDLAEKFDSARNMFYQANQILGRDIAKLCFSGPEEELKATQNTQPSLFTVEAILVDILKSKGIQPSYTAGHSLGEYGALYGAGVLSFEDGLKLVARRGELMAKAGQKRPGTMAAVIGLTVEQIRAALAQVTDGIVVPANQNSPGQTVISGEVAAVNKACEVLKQAGAKRAILLPVSGAFHSPLMKEAAEEFSAYLAGVSFSVPRCPVVANVTAQPEKDPVQMKKLLIDQLMSPVRWVETMQFLGTAGQASALEVGPGKVLKGLAADCALPINVVSCGTAENVFSLSA